MTTCKPKHIPVNSHSTCVELAGLKKNPDLKCFVTLFVSENEQLDKLTAHASAGFKQRNTSSVHLRCTLPVIS
jgi:hypothetical protein